MLLPMQARSTAIVQAFRVPAIQASVVTMGASGTHYPQSLRVVFVTEDPEKSAPTFTSGVARQLRSAASGSYQLLADTDRLRCVCTRRIGARVPRYFAVDGPTPDDDRRIRPNIQSALGGHLSTGSDKGLVCDHDVTSHLENAGIWLCKAIKGRPDLLTPNMQVRGSIPRVGFLFFLYVLCFTCIWLIL